MLAGELEVHCRAALSSGMVASPEAWIAISVSLSDTILHKRGLGSQSTLAWSMNSQVRVMDSAFSSSFHICSQRTRYSSGLTSRSRAAMCSLPLPPCLSPSFCVANVSACHISDNDSTDACLLESSLDQTKVLGHN